MARGILDILESAYASHLPGQEWLAGVNEAFATRLPNVVGWGGHVVSKSQDGPPAFLHAVLTGEEDAMTIFGPMHAGMSPEFAEAIFPTGTWCAFLSEEWERVSRLRDWGEETEAILHRIRGYVRSRGGDDLLMCCSYDHTGTGVLLAAITTGDAKLSRASRDLHRRAAVHVAAGMRLRRVLETRPDDPTEAWLEPNGRLAHAQGRAAPADARARLTDAVRRVDQARARDVRRDDARALELWQGLVAGRWSLVDRYDTDGKRYYVAMANPPGGLGERALTETEAQVVAQVVAGEPNAIIAYAMGVHESTIAGHLRNAMRKLGARSRVELIRVARALGA